MRHTDAHINEKLLGSSSSLLSEYIHMSGTPGLGADFLAIKGAQRQIADLREKLQWWTDWYRGEKATTTIGVDW